MKESQVQAAYLQFDGDFPDPLVFALMSVLPTEGAKVKNTGSTIAVKADSLRKWRIYAYIILALHAACSLFVLMMPVLVPLGAWLSWNWVQNPWLRYGHMGLVLFIAGEVIMRKPCPLMTWENRCRVRAGMPLYTTGFFDYWVENILKIPFKDWMFESIFLAVGLASVAQFFLLGPLR